MKNLAEKSGNPSLRRFLASQISSQTFALRRLCNKLFESTKFDFDPEKLRDQCVQWIDVWKPPQDCEKCFTVEMTFWEYPIGIPWTDWWLGHAAARITLCSGRVFFIDNGWWGGKDHVYDRPKPPNPWVCQYKP